MAAEKIDFEAEGLLEGLDGNAREARLQLLTELADDGVPLDELRRAVEDERLALLPVERVLSSEAPPHTGAEIAERSGLSIEFLVRLLQALGLPAPDPDERVLTDDDLDEAINAKAYIDAGMPEEAVLEGARVIGMTMAQLADANRSLIGDVFIRPGDTERDLGMRYAAATEALTPLLMRTLNFVFRRQLLEAIRQGVLSETEIATGQAGRSRDVTIAFADLVGFTKLGERLEVSQIGELSGRLSEMARTAAKPPVRLVKMIGDAAMLVAAEPDPLLDATMELVESAAGSDDVPSLRAGVAHGPALSRGGDWYGRPVNLAARITGYARPDSVLCAADVADQVGAGFRFSNAGRRRFKGIQGDVALKRARRASDSRWRRG